MRDMTPAEVYDECLALGVKDPVVFVLWNHAIIGEWTTVPSKQEILITKNKGVALLAMKSIFNTTPWRKALRSLKESFR